MSAPRRPDETPSNPPVLAPLPQGGGLDDVVQIAARLGAVPIAAIALLADDRPRLRAVLGVAPVGAEAFVDAVAPLIGWCAATRHTILVPDTATESALRQLVADVGHGAAPIRMVAATPIFSPGGAVAAVLVVADQVARAFDPTTLDLLERAARCASPFIGVSAPSYDDVAGLQTVLESITQGVVVHGPDASILLANSAAARILGLSRDQLLGRVPYDMDGATIHRDGSPFPGEDHPASISLRHGVEVHDVIMGVLRPDQERRWVLINSMPMRVPYAGAPGVVATFSDITELTELNDQLQESLRELAAAAQERAALLSSVSHDIRAPLASIRMMTELLEDRADAITADQRRELVHRVRVEARRTEGVLADLVSANRVGSGLDAPRRQLIDLDDLVRHIARDFSNDDHEVRLGELTGDLRITADRAQIERILDNLVSNALRHTPAGSTVLVSAVEQGATVDLAVDDDGPGVTDALKRSIFGAYVRGERSADRPGSGLGLYLVQQFAEFHGGTAWCEDSPLGGARFVVTLPIAPQ